MNTYYCDFETSQLNGKTWVWLACALDENDNYKIYTSISSFLNSFKENSKLYFHNLKFDGSYIIVHLLKSGYKWTSERLNNNEFKTSIDEYGVFYSIEFMRKSKRIKIYDSYKLLPFSLKKVAETFKLNTLKGEIDYTIYRPENIYEPTKEEIEYIKNDCYIMREGLRFFEEKNLTRITIASNALTDFKSTLKHDFVAFFPKLDIQLDAKLRKYYKGGFCYAVDYHAGNIIENVDVYDVNSLYPYVMYSYDYPMGNPRYFKGKYTGENLFLQHIRCEFSIKEGYLPTIQIKNSSRFAENVYLKSSEGEIVDLYLPEKDLELFLRHYNHFNLEYIDGYEFLRYTNLFKTYVDKWKKVKENSTGGLRELAKLMLNSLYGKFATNPVRINKMPYLVDGALKFEKLPPQKTSPIYTPISIFVTSYARYETITSAQIFYKEKRLLYCDTDSIHCIKGDTHNLKIDDKKLGYWKLEKHFDKVKYLHQKCYFGTNGDKKIYAIAGLPKTQELEDHLNFDTFKEGFEWNILKAKNIDGGVYLMETTYQIK